MLKRWFGILLALGYLLSGILAFQTPVRAEEESPYTITEFTSNITLQEDGSATFEESITYELQQTSVTIVKPIPMAYSSKVEGLEVVRRFPASAEDPQVDFNDTPLTYNFTPVGEEGDIYHITTPIEGSKREEVVLVYRYKLLDTVFLYKDTAAFFWQFFQADQNHMDIRNINIEVQLPPAGSAQEWSGYIRGTAFADKELSEDGIFRITGGDMMEGEFLEAVLLMPNSLFPDGRKIIDNLAENEIVSEMTLWEDQAARTRREEELKFYGGWGIALLSILLSAGTALLLFMKTRNKKVIPSNPSVDEKGFPASSITPAETGVLMNNGKLTSRDLFATVLHLIQGRFLELNHDGNQKGSLILREDKQRETLKAHEEYVLNWLLASLGDGRQLSLEAFQQLLETYQKGRGPKGATWESLVYGRSGRKGLWENICKMKAWAMAAVVFSLLTAALAGLVLGNQPAGILAGVVAAALAVYVLTLKKTDKDARNQQAQWETYKEGLRVRSADANNPLPLVQWEEHLVYGVPLGIADEILKNLMQNHESTEFDDGNLTILYHTNHSWLSKNLRG